MPSRTVLKNLKRDEIMTNVVRVVEGFREADNYQEFTTAMETLGTSLDEFRKIDVIFGLPPTL